VKFWVDKSRLSDVQLKGLFSPLNTVVDTEVLFRNATWADVLRRMVSNACIFAWECRLDKFDHYGNTMRCQDRWTGDKKAMTLEKRREELFAALQKIPGNFNRPSLLSVPSFDPKGSVTRQDDDRMARLARATTAADDDLVEIKMEQAGMKGEATSG
jgi:hypothetical protein